MAAGQSKWLHFGWPKITFDRISRHFRSIRNFFSQNGYRGPFWMTENHFRSHFSLFQINTQLFFFHKMAAGGHFGWPKIIFNQHYSPFQITTQLIWFFFHKMATGGHFGWPKITFDRISRYFRLIRNFFFLIFFSQNGCRRPFWMTENHFWSYFSPFQINTQLFNFFHKLAAGGHFGWPKITFDRISRHFRSIRNFYLFSQIGCRRPFWMTENHFRSHFSLFQINTQLLFFFTKWLLVAILDDQKSLLITITRHFRSKRNFYFFLKMAAGGHFRWTKITFNRITRHFRSKCNFFIYFSKWSPGAILDDRKSLLITFLAISDQYATFFFFSQNGCWWPFWMTENHF